MFFSEDHLPPHSYYLVGSRKRNIFCNFLPTLKIIGTSSLRAGCIGLNLGSLCRNGSLHFITLTFPSAWFSLIFELGILAPLVFSSDKSSFKICKELLNPWCEEQMDNQQHSKFCHGFLFCIFLGNEKCAFFFPLFLGNAKCAFLFPRE